jgi:hypothetical protein
MDDNGKWIYIKLVNVDFECSLLINNGSLLLINNNLR